MRNELFEAQESIDTMREGVQCRDDLIEKACATLHVAAFEAYVPVVRGMSHALLMAADEFVHRFPRFVVQPVAMRFGDELRPTAVDTLTGEVAVNVARARTGSDAMSNQTHRVEIGSSEPLVVEKAFGPAIFANIRVTADPARGWVIDRQRIDSGKWIEVVVIPAQVDDEFEATR